MHAAGDPLAAQRAGALRAGSVIAILALVGHRAVPVLHRP
jgi:hypothetical protein